MARQIPYWRNSTKPFQYLTAFPGLPWNCRSFLRQVSNIQHRQFLQRKFHDIEMAQRSPQALAKIGNEIDTWCDREFPVQGKH